MRKPLIAGNWKMNLLHSKVPRYFEEFFAGLKGKDPAKADVLLAVPSLFLSTAKELSRFVHIAAQTVHEKEEGAFTGEISVPMLLDLGINWTLVGHSERRQYYNETDESVALKTKTCLTKGMHPIVCVGETRAERESGRTEEVLERQLTRVLGVTGKSQDFTLAYEPVWAIGTGLTASDEQAQASHAFLRHLLNKQLGAEAASSMRILYGGSVKSSNIQGLMSQADVDGALIGGASVDPKEFARIVELCS